MCPASCHSDWALRLSVGINDEHVALVKPFLPPDRDKNLFTTIFNLKMFRRCLSSNNYFMKVFSAKRS